MNSSYLIPVNSRADRTRLSVQLCEVHSDAFSELNGLAWADLNQVPSWMVIEKTRLEEFQLLCGTLFLAPVINTITDTSVLRTIAASVGEDQLMRVMDWQTANPQSSEPDELQQTDLRKQLRTDAASILRKSGAAILLAYCNTPGLICLGFKIHGLPAGKMTERNADAFVAQAMKIIDVNRDSRSAAA